MVEKEEEKEESKTNNIERKLNAEYNAAKPLPFYLSLTVGKSKFGRESFGEVTKGNPMNYGMDAAYYFNTWFGAGLKTDMSYFKVNFGENKLYREQITFFGPALYGKTGKGAFAITASAGAGWLKKRVKPYDDEIWMGKSRITDFLSVNVNYMFTRKVGLCVDFHTSIKSFSDCTGIRAGINYRF